MAIWTVVRNKTFQQASHFMCTCGKQAEEYHHWSYAPEHWLDVIPVCNACHKKIHEVILASKCAYRPA